MTIELAFFFSPSFSCIQTRREFDLRRASCVRRLVSGLDDLDAWLCAVGSHPSTAGFEYLAFQGVSVGLAYFGFIRTGGFR